MKEIMMITVLSLAAPFAYAETPAGGAATESTSVSFTQVDSDRDGMISKQEAQSFAAVEVVFDDADANKDGALDNQEFSGIQTSTDAE